MHPIACTANGDDGRTRGPDPHGGFSRAWVFFPSLFLYSTRPSPTMRPRSINRVSSNTLKRRTLITALCSLVLLVQVPVLALLGPPSVDYDDDDGFDYRCRWGATHDDARRTTTSMYGALTSRTVRYDANFLRRVCRTRERASRSRSRVDDDDDG